MCYAMRIELYFVVLLVLCSTAKPQCGTNQWGDNCKDCHCLNGADQCDPVNGTCADSQCGRGWSHPPLCQTECKENLQWGVNCSKACHCAAGVECNPINGVCGGSCHPEWSGPSCMIRLTQLTSPPRVTSADCGNIDLAWQAWVEEVNIGDAPVKSYSIQQKKNDSAWTELTIIYATNDNLTEYNLTLSDIDDATVYSFRIVANREEYDKPVDGIPGPASEPKSLIELCQDKSQAPEMLTQSLTSAVETTIEAFETTTEANYQDEYTTTEATPVVGREPVQNLRAALDSSTGFIEVAWAEPETNSTIVAYKLSYQIIGIGDCNDSYRGPVKTEIVGSSQLGSTLRFIQYWRKYRISVTAIFGQEEGQWANTIVLSKEIAPTGSVQNFQHFNLTSSSVVFTWNELPCERIGGRNLTYKVLFWKLNGQTQETIFIKSVDKPYVVATDLNSLQMYGIRVCAENSVGTGVYMDDYTVTTDGQRSLKPTDLRVLNSTERAIVLGWSAPFYPLHQIQEYSVTYQSTTESTVKTIRVPATSNSPFITVANLSPSTQYHFRVKAKASQQWGPISEILLATTLQSLPGPPTQLQVLSTEICLQVTWEYPDSRRGEILAFKVTCHGARSGEEIERQTLQLESTICSLDPASQYTVSVAAMTSRGYGPTSSVSAWTEVRTPEIPNTPIVRAIRETSITIQIQPSVLSGGPVSAYYIVVYDRKRAKRSVADPVKTLGINGYTAAALSPSEVTRARTFVVGDGQYYGGYLNKPLKDDNNYTIYYIVQSTLNGVSKMAYAEVPLLISTNKIVPTSTLPPEGSTAKPAKEKDDSLVVMGIVLGCVLVILAVVVVALVLYCFRKKKNQLQQRDAKNPNWLSYYTDHFYDSSQSEQVSLSKTYSLSELGSQATLASDNTSMDPLNCSSISVSEMHHRKPKVNCESEYQKLPQGSLFPCKAAKMSANKEKNRFEHILPYDHSRVVLKNRANDYINASYIDGYDAPKAYISAQSPFDMETIAAFWHMVYQENVTQIVFMARLVEDGVVKCVPYWPQKNSKEYGALKIHFVSSESYANFNVYTFDIEPIHHKIRRVTQYQFTSWPDHGIPDDCIGFLEFLLRVRVNTKKGAGPLLVHCGTGVSRSAVFIAVDAVLKQARVENEVNVLEFCQKMRKTRTMMVRTLKQYTFIYDVIMEALLVNYTMVGTDLKDNYRLLSEANPVTKRSHFADQFEVLENHVSGLTADKSAAGLKKENSAKNRFNCLDLLPPDAHRPILKTPMKNGRTDYINALYVDSYSQQKAFIITQSPMISTLVDFWQMIYDNKVRTIVMLDGQSLRDDTCARYWPSGDPALQNYGPFSVSLESEESHDLVTIRSLKLTRLDSDTEDVREIYQLQCEAWPPGDNVPNSRETIMELFELAEGSQCEPDSQAPPPIVVHCMDGATRSGLFCVCCITAETLRIEGQVDIFHTIKRIKMLRPKVIPGLEQYKFCFKFLWDFLQTRLRKKKLISKRE